MDAIGESFGAGRLDSRQAVGQHRRQHLDHLAVTIVRTLQFTPDALQAGRQEPVLERGTVTQGAGLPGETYWSPRGPNWGHFESPETEGLIEQIFNQFDEEKRLGLLTELHELEGRLAVMIFVVHDLNTRAMSPKVHGFVQAQSWFQDLTPVTVSP